MDRGLTLSDDSLNGISSSILWHDVTMILHNGNLKPKCS